MFVLYYKSNFDFYESNNDLRKSLFGLCDSNKDLRILSYAGMDFVMGFVVGPWLICFLLWSFLSDDIVCIC